MARPGPNYGAHDDRMRLCPVPAPAAPPEASAPGAGPSNSNSNSRARRHGGFAEAPGGLGGSPAAPSAASWHPAPDGLASQITWGLRGGGRSCPIDGDSGHGNSRFIRYVGGRFIVYTVAAMSSQSRTKVIIDTGFGTKHSHAVASTLPTLRFPGTLAAPMRTDLPHLKCFSSSWHCVQPCDGFGCIWSLMLPI